MKRIFTTSLLSVILVSVAYSQEASTTPTLEQRLEHLVEKLEATDDAFKIELRERPTPWIAGADNE
mgnify:CR=1 FL=1